MACHSCELRNGSELKMPENSKNNKKLAVKLLFHRFTQSDGGKCQSESCDLTVINNGILAPFQCSLFTIVYVALN